MSTMISEVYSAFRKAGVPEDDAKAAAEALSCGGANYCPTPAPVHHAGI